MSWFKFSETLSDFFRDLIDFMSDAIEKQGIISLSSSCSKSYAPVVSSDSEAIFLEEGEDAAFLNCVFFLHRLA